ncbi:hypothetical protein [Exiguobacterium sp. AM39-5BH]|uniref:hypothetical protein n=1 Tax=Exiguobacterium sp. AM39-5BH TaxID=2292355 RepID=UPI000FE1B434|nr:hypothetical protein [Exiguobacterium sp. AM39-5BH]RHB46912.1 hypothetical protein DW881_13090 [Exiguobacterium sp. AM39-5BH]
MKQTFIVKESRELPTEIRPLLFNLYSFDKAPNLFNLPPDCSLYTGWRGNELVAAIHVDYRDFITAHQIRMTDATYKDPTSLRGLIDHVLYQLLPQIRQKTTISLNFQKNHPFQRIDSFTAIGFMPHLETTVYEVSLPPYQKDTYAQWKLCLEYPETYESWLASRNQYAELLPEALPLTDRAINDFHQKQGAFHSLRRNGIIVGTMYSRIEFSRCYIHELCLMCDPPMLQEGLSFIQQSSYLKLKHIQDIMISTTSRQSNIRDTLLKRNATETTSTTYTFLKELLPQPYLR